MSHCSHESVDTPFARFMMLLPMGETTCHACHSRLGLSLRDRSIAWALIVVLPGILGLLMTSSTAYGVGSALCILFALRRLNLADLETQPA